MVYANIDDILKTIILRGLLLNRPDFIGG